MLKRIINYSELKTLLFGETKVVPKSTMFFSRSFDSIGGIRSRAKNHVESFLHYTQATKNSIILDVGCGYGSFVRMLVKCGYKYTFGVDIFDVFPDFAKTCLRMDVMDIPHRQQFDIIHLKMVLDYFEGGDFDRGHLEIPSSEDLANQLNDLLKPGGQIANCGVDDSGELGQKFIASLTALGYSRQNPGFRSYAIYQKPK